ncbi:MAG TPA: M50 family metallopeptidase [Acidimicrobiales bacterium]|nr:M50 family metallopeptidase [Acidimicrobiales bacterium]
MRDTVRLGRIGGVPVGLNWSLIVIVGVFAFALAGNRFPIDAPGYHKEWYAVAGVATALALLASVLAHEFGHAYVARRAGLEVEGITLSWMGGVTRIVGDARTPRGEIAVAAIGPVISLLLGGVFVGVGFGASAAGVGNLTVVAIDWLAVINIVLAGFNLIPAAPLDGGKILHAVVWWIARDRWRATHVSSRAGLLLAGGVAALGLYEILGRGDEVNGLFVLVLGWWLLNAARDEEQLAQVQHLLGGVPVHDVMRPVAAAPGWLAREEFVERYARLYPGWVWLLERWGGGFNAVIVGDTLMAAAPTPPGTRTVDLAVPVEAAAGADPREEVLAALERSGGHRLLLVVEGERTVGAVLPADIEAILRARHRPGPTVAPAH